MKELISGLGIYKEMDGLFKSTKNLTDIAVFLNDCSVQICLAE